jgi:pyruvate,water dikinase
MSESAPAFTLPAFRLPAFTLPFNRIHASDLPLVGGKGANLGEMTQAGFPVPPGFCVTTAAFRLFMQASGQADKIYHNLDSLAAGDVEGVRRMGQEVRTSLSSVPLPPEVESAIVAAWQELGVNDSYAVRSSATAEDLPDASFAGQQDTYLNIEGKEQLLKRVRDCWISLFTDRAILYRAQNHFPHRDVYLSVVVQRMILPDVSGILFTADPVSNNRQVISIDASYGLGEALVAGLVSPDLYKVDKRSHSITTKIGDKQLAIHPKPEGGTYQEQITGKARHARVLDDAQVLALADLGVRIEAHYGKPQDIEWCMAQGQLYIVQARPITSLYPLPQPAPQNDTLHLYFSFSHAQVMTDPMPPMGIAFWRMLFPFGKGKDRLSDNPYLTSAGGRIYVDLTPLLRLPKLGQALPKLLRIADSLSAGAIRGVIQRTEFTKDGTRGHAKPTTLLRWLFPVLSGAIARIAWLSPDGAAEHLSAIMDTYIEKARAQLTTAPAGLPRLQVAEWLNATIFADHVIVMPSYIAAGMLSRVLLARLTRSLPNQPQIAADIEALGRGLSGNVTTEMDLQVGDMADAARQSPALVQHLSQGDAQSALATAPTIPGSEAFLAAWHRFIQRYGMRGPSEIDISRPAWVEQPASLLQVVIANLQHATPGAHRTKHAQLAAEGKAAVVRLEKAARHGPLGLIRAPMVRRLARVARALIPVREHPKYMLIQLRGLIRDVILECAAMLQKQGRIDEIGDVWFLDWHELAAALENPSQELRTRIHARRQEYQRFWHMVPPRVMTSNGEIPTVAHDQEGVPAGALAGSPVSAGIVEGKAKVILDPQRELLSPGEILVAPFTDPGWTPLFINASGLVMETGGLMTHGSVIAREYGIPAVVAVIDATKKIHTGQRIRVNGSEGYVEILEG